MNEPQQQRAAPPGLDGWSLQSRAAAAIREIDPETPIIVECNANCAPPGYLNMSPFDLPNVIYEVHVYGPGDFTHQGIPGMSMERCRWPDASRGWDRDYLRKMLAPVRDFQLRHGARIYVGEFSAVAWAEGAGDWLRDATALFAEYGWDWTYHAFREWRGWSVEHDGPDIVRPEECDTAAQRAELLVSRLEKLQSFPLPWEKVGIAHLNCGLTWREGHPADVFDSIPEERFRAAMRFFAVGGAGIELNCASFSNADFAARPESHYRLFRIAKEEGCRFYLASDAHHPTGLESVPRHGPAIVEALDHDVTECRPRIPWCCNMAGPAAGREHDDWFVPWTPALGYYDPVHLARRIPASCRVEIPQAGLGDYISPPSGVMAFYNALPCPRKITFIQGAMHLTLPPEPWQTARRAG